MPQVVIHDKGQLEYRCPGCGGSHAIPVLINQKEDKSWNWNGDVEKPTVRPSVKHHYPDIHYKRHPGLPLFVCHYHITEGRIEYCNDCTHDFKEKKPQMTPYTEAEVKIRSLQENQ